MKKYFLQKSLVDVANALEELNLYKDASAVDKIMIKIAEDVDLTKYQSTIDSFGKGFVVDMVRQMFKYNSSLSKLSRWKDITQQEIYGTLVGMPKNTDQQRVFSNPDNLKVASIALSYIVKHMPETAFKSSSGFKSALIDGSDTFIKSALSSKNVENVTKIKNIIVPLSGIEIKDDLSGPNVPVLNSTQLQQVKDDEDAFIFWNKTNQVDDIERHKWNSYDPKTIDGRTKRNELVQDVFQRLRVASPGLTWEAVHNQVFNFKNKNDATKDVANPVAATDTAKMDTKPSSANGTTVITAPATTDTGKPIDIITTKSKGVDVKPVSEETSSLSVPSSSKSVSKTVVKEPSESKYYTSDFGKVGPDEPSGIALPAESSQFHQHLDALKSSKDIDTAHKMIFDYDSTIKNLRNLRDKGASMDEIKSAVSGHDISDSMLKNPSDVNKLIGEFKERKQQTMDAAKKFASMKIRKIKMS